MCIHNRKGPQRQDSSPTSQLNEPIIQDADRSVGDILDWSTRIGQGGPRHAPPPRKPPKTETALPGDRDLD